MVIDAIVFAFFTISLVIGVLWIVGKLHRFEEEVTWSRRRE